MGAKNAESVGKLQDEAQNGDFDMVLHIGDFAYNFEDMGDEFMRQVEPIAAYVPYMTVVGNHEYQGKSFPHYKNRFTMPGSDDNLFYSFDLGHVHFIAFSTEFYYGNGHYSVPDIIKQWNWIKDDLEMRIGINRNSSGSYQYGLEDLFYAYGVDLELWAHEHIYERMYPVYNRTVFKGTGDPYRDPPAPVHIVAGSAGCKENTDIFKPTLSPWTAFTSTAYGFSRMQVFNETHIYLEQTAALNDTEVDHFWLVKHSHKPYDASDLARLKQFGTFVGSD
ncbi:acid phosphatase [Aphelenchoides avenae]|nr:acid phosphatase [Aphelenchus avenae]